MDGCHHGSNDDMAVLSRALDGGQGCGVEDGSPTPVPAIPTARQDGGCGAVLYYTILYCAILHEYTVL